MCGQATTAPCEWWSACFWSVDCSRHARFCREIPFVADSVTVCDGFCEVRDRRQMCSAVRGDARTSSHCLATGMFEQDQFLSALFCVHQLCLIVFLSVFWLGFVSCFLCLLLRCSHVDETRPSDFAQEMHLVYRPSWQSWQAIFAVQPCKYASRKTLEVRERSLYLEECAASIPTQTNNRFDVQLHRHIFSSSFKFFWSALRCRRKQTRT